MPRKTGRIQLKLLAAVAMLLTQAGVHAHALDCSGTALAYRPYCDHVQGKLEQYLSQEQARRTKTGEPACPEHELKKIRQDFSQQVYSCSKRLGSHSRALDETFGAAVNYGCMGLKYLSATNSIRQRCSHPSPEPPKLDRPEIPQSR